MSTLSLLGSAAYQGRQFGRQFQIIVSNSQGQAIDVSQFHVKFNIKRSGYMTPNSADILIYNLSDTAAILIKQEFTNVVVSAGYTGNFGVIFKGNIKQAIVGRESATETFVNLICGDGEQSYNFAVMNQTIGSAANGGSSPANQLDAAVQAMGSYGVGSSYVSPLPSVKLPRGKVLYGNARDYIQTIASTNNCNWSIQDEKIVFLPEKAYLPTQVVQLNNKTGMIGTPQQTVEGIMAKSLLNPQIKCHTRVQINNRTVAQAKIDFSTPGSAANLPASLAYDGMYYVWVAEHTGDTRGVPWYTGLRMMTVDASDNPINSVQPGYNA